MSSARIDAYVSRLEHQLRRHGLTDTRIVEEVREHLVDAVDAGLRRGLSLEAAEDEAFGRFGRPETIAAAFANERFRILKRLVIVLYKIVGLLRGHPRHPVHYHDVAAPSQYHFGLRLKRPIRRRLMKMSTDERERFIAQQRESGEDVGAFETDPRERLARFLEEFGRRTFGSSGTLESLTLLEDMTDSAKRGGRYEVAFASGARMVWTVALSADGSVWFDGAYAPA